VESQAFEPQSLLTILLTILVTACQRLSLFTRHGIYQQFTYIDHTQYSPAPDVGAQQTFFAESLYGLYCPESFAQFRYQKCTQPID